MKQDITSVFEKGSAADVCFVKTLLLPDLILTMSKASHNYLACPEEARVGEVGRGQGEVWVEELG